MRTPVRDALGLNEAAGGYTAEEIVSLRAQKQAQARMRAALRDQLSTLPAPENEYSVALPDQLPGEDEEGESRARRKRVGSWDGKGFERGGRRACQTGSARLWYEGLRDSFPAAGMCTTLLLCLLCWCVLVVYLRFMLSTATVLYTHTHNTTQHP